MSDRGRPRKPRNLKLIEGTYREDREPDHPPTPQAEAPTCPTWLGREAKRIWRRLAPELAEVGLLAKVDRATFAAFCQAYHRWWTLEKKRSDTEEFFTTDSGYSQRHPVHKAADEAMERMVELGARFGMTPADRSGIDLPPMDADDPATEFLKHGS